MADLTKDILDKKGHKWKTLADFREECGVSNQALQYAMKNDLVDFIKVGPKAAAIIMTEKTLSYTPKASATKEA